MRMILLALAGIVVLLVGAFYYMTLDAMNALPWNRAGVGAEKTVVSRDGATIAYTQLGQGPAIILVASALADRDATAKLSSLLAADFTVINYDRRGRGKSSDHAPFAVAREVEDIEALAAGHEPVVLFGSSSGAALALEAANSLGEKTKALVLFEPPFIVDNSRPPMPDDFASRLEKLVEANRQDDAVKQFFADGMGIPAGAVRAMSWLMPGWSKMTAMAHTIPYDLAALTGTQTGKPLPADRWPAVSAPALVLVGSRSEPFFHTGAKALVGVLRQAEYRSLEGRDHSAVLMAPQDVATAIKGFCAGLASPPKSPPVPAR